MRRLWPALALLLVLLAGCGTPGRPTVEVRPHIKAAHAHGHSITVFGHRFALRSAGAPVVGEVLSTTPGTWGGNPTRFTYLWEDCDSGGSGCSAIGGATGSSYLIVSGDLGHTLRVISTAYNNQGSAGSVSAATGLVTNGTPGNTVLPALSGTATVNQTLFVSSGTWTNTPTSYTYQWQRCSPGCANIDSSGSVAVSDPAAGSNGYTLQAADAGDTIQVVVSATNGAGSTTATSGVSGTVASATAPYYAELNTSTFTSGGCITHWCYWDPNYAGSSTWFGTYNHVLPARSENRITEPPGVGGSGVLKALGTNNPGDVHGGCTSTGATCSVANGNIVDGQDTWYHALIYFPQGDDCFSGTPHNTSTFIIATTNYDCYMPDTGTANYIEEWHDDSNTQACGSGANSTAIDVQGLNAAQNDNSYVDTHTPSPHGKMYLRTTGGDCTVAASNYQCWFLTSPAQSGSCAVNASAPDLLYNHWYDITTHIIWSTSAVTGYVQWWVDGTKYLDAHMSTLYTNAPGGAPSWTNLFDVEIYPWGQDWYMSSWDAAVMVGSTCASVGGNCP